MAKSKLNGRQSGKKNNKLEKLLTFSNKSDRIWASPSPDAIERWKATPLLFGAKGGRFEVGRVINDSWATAPAVALRDIVDGHIRRLELKAGKVVLEIVAERITDHWEFVARVQTGEKTDNNYILNIGRIRLLPYASGFYHWSSSWVPRTIKLISFKRQIAFEKVLW
jgi:hypothetical protein